MKVAAKDLKLADVIRAFDGPFGTAVVSRVTSTDVHLFRPYAAPADFSYGGDGDGQRIICYTGTEEFSIPRDTHTYERYREGNVK